MSLVRTLLHLLLSIALVAGTLWPVQGEAAHAHGAPAAASAPPCHGDAEASVAQDIAATGDCCTEAGDCACDCLHHAPVAMVPARGLLPLPPARPLVALTDDTSPAPALRPWLRPPIV